MLNFIRNLFKTKKQKEVEKVAKSILGAQNDILTEIIKDMGIVRFKVPEEPQAAKDRVPTIPVRKHPRYSEPEPECAAGYSEGDSND